MNVCVCARACLFVRMYAFVQVRWRTVDVSSWVEAVGRQPNHPLARRATRNVQEVPHLLSRVLAKLVRTQRGSFPRPNSATRLGSWYVCITQMVSSSRLSPCLAFFSDIMGLSWHVKICAGADGDNAEYDVPVADPATKPEARNHTVAGEWVPIPASQTNTFVVHMHAEELAQSTKLVSDTCRVCGRCACL